MFCLVPTGNTQKRTQTNVPEWPKKTLQSALIQWSISHGFVALVSFNPLKNVSHQTWMLQVNWKEWVLSPGQKYRFICRQDMCIVCPVREKKANMILCMISLRVKVQKNKNKKSVTMCIFWTIFDKYQIYMKKKKKHPKVSKRIRLYVYFFLGFVDFWSSEITRRIWLAKCFWGTPFLVWNPGSTLMLISEWKLPFAQWNTRSLLFICILVNGNKMSTISRIFYICLKKIIGTSHVCWLEKLTSFHGLASFFRTWWGCAMEITGLSSSRNPLR